MKHAVGNDTRPPPVTNFKRRQHHRQSRCRRLTFVHFARSRFLLCPLGFARLAATTGPKILVLSAEAARKSRGTFARFENHRWGGLGLCLNGWHWAEGSGWH